MKQIIITLNDEGEVSRQVKGISQYHEIFGLLHQALLFFNHHYCVKMDGETHEPKEPQEDRTQD